MKPIEDFVGKIICGDCLEVMKEMPDESVDLVLTDPPYDHETHAGGRYTKEIKFGNVGFKSMDIVPIIKQLLRLSKNWTLVFTSVENLGIIRKEYPCCYIRGGIWDRIVNSPQISGDRPAQAVEGIAILHNKGIKKWNGGGRAGIWRAMVERGQKEHDAQKPLKLIKELLRDFSNKGDLIFDPFLGSGTTALAAEMLGRKWIGIEINPDYCKIAQERIDNYRKQLKLEFK